MPGRGPQTFKKRQKEQERKEKRAEKLARRQQKKPANPDAGVEGVDDLETPAVDEPEAASSPVPSSDHQ